LTIEDVTEFCPKKNVEKKPLNVTEIVWILVVSILVLGGIAYYLAFYQPGIEPGPDVPAVQTPTSTLQIGGDTLLDALKSQTNINTTTIVTPEQNNTLNALKSTTTQPQNRTVNNSLLDSLKANK